MISFFPLLGTDPSLKGDCIYTVALSNESNTIETPTNLVHIPVQCDSETYQALTQMSKEPVHLHQPDYSQIANIPIQNKVIIFLYKYNFRTCFGWIDNIFRWTIRYSP